MVSDIPLRERLAADLELLGILADPEKGVLAGMFSADPPQVTTNADPAPIAGRWRNHLGAIFALMRRRCMARPGFSLPRVTSAQPLRWLSALRHAPELPRYERRAP